MNYYKIDVILPYDGYSFLVGSENKLDKDDVISMALARDLFIDEEDVNVAQMEEVEYGDYDYNGLKHTLIIFK